MTQPDALPDEIRVELERVVRRWQQLPLDHALRASGAVRSLAERLAGEALPDLGPVTTMHQLQVCAYDVARQLVATGRADGIRALADDLAGLRREIG